MIRLLIFFVLLLSVTSLAAQSPPALLPAPQQLVWTRESFILTGTVAIHPTVAAAGAVGESVAAFIRQISQATVYVGKPSGTQPVIVLRIDSGGVLSKRPEGYTLTITRRRITLTGASETGLFRACQTLRQLLQPAPVRFAGCHITDYPAFRSAVLCTIPAAALLPSTRLSNT